MQYDVALRKNEMKLKRNTPFEKHTRTNTLRKMSIASPSRTFTPHTVGQLPLLLLLLLLGLAVVAVRGQSPDSDEAFELQHQDIGRISGLPSGAPQVAPQSTVVTRQQQQQQQQPSFVSEPASASPVQHAAAAATPDRGQSRHTQRQSAHGSQRKPNRVTLVARRDPVVTPAAQPAPAAVQLPAPPQQFAPSLQTTPAAAPFELAQPTFAPPQLQPSQHPHPHHHHHQEASGGQLSPMTVVSGPALNSFRATGGSVSPRHSALIAQVAAERAAAASVIPAHSEPGALAAPAFSQQQPLPSPRSFASFAPAPVQPVAAPTHHLHQHGHLQAASQPQAAVNQLEEPLVAPSFEHVLGHGCPHKGVFSWENKDHCDRYYMCTNGTFTEEACPNGLAYSQMGAVYQHCAYNWNVNCGSKKTAEPIASPGCPWQFGIFPILSNGRCSIDYFACEWGVPETKRCTPEGLFYDDRIKGCQWADQLGCKSEALLNFKCPAEDEDNPYWPYPRYYHNTQDVIVCVNEQPRLVHCNEDQLVDPGSLACVEVKKKKARPL